MLCLKKNKIVQSNFWDIQLHTREGNSLSDLSSHTIFIFLRLFPYFTPIFFVNIDPIFGKYVLVFEATSLKNVILVKNCKYNVNITNRKVVVWVCKKVFWHFDIFPKKSASQICPLHIYFHFGNPKQHGAFSCIKTRVTQKKVTHLHLQSPGNRSKVNILNSFIYDSLFFVSPGIC